jgi:hypothetical protein
MIQKGHVFIGFFWLPPRDSNPDMLIQSPTGLSTDQQHKGSSSENPGKVRQNPQPPRNQNNNKSGGEE